MGAFELPDGRICRTGRDKVRNGLIWCAGCQSWLDPAEFGSTNRYKHGRRTKCRLCIRDQASRHSPGYSRRARAADCESFAAHDEELLSLVRSRVADLHEQRRDLQLKLDIVNKKLTEFAVAGQGIGVGCLD